MFVMFVIDEFNERRWQMVKKLMRTFICFDRSEVHML